MALAVFGILAMLAILRGSEAACECPAADWLSMDDVGCFKYFDQTKTFLKAEATCVFMSQVPEKLVHLASVHSQEEYDAVTSLIPQPTGFWDPQVFVGLRLRDGVTPAWTDGSFYDYQNWCRDDPNAHPEGRGAISAGYGCNGLWVDVPPNHNDQFTFICKSPCL